MTPAAILARDVGEFDAEITVHPVFPGATAPSVSRGRMVGRLVAGDRWLVLDYVNPESGFGGHGIYGWDEAQGRFVGTWVDNVTGTLRILLGTWDPAAGGVVYEGEVPTGSGSMRQRQVTSAPDPDTLHFVAEFELPEHGRVTYLTAVYRRRAG